MKSVTRLLLALSLFVGIVAAPGCGEKGKEAPPEKAKAQNTTPVDPDAEPADSKPADPKPADPAPADSKPADPAPADAKPADAKPADPKANPDAKPKETPKPGSAPSK